jgi:hypothetical protein
MSQQVPLLGVNAVILKGTEPIGSAKFARIIVENEVVKAYSIGSKTPVALEIGNQSFRVSLSKWYIDNAFLSDVLNGTKVTIEVRPAGEGTGKPKITLSNVVFRRWQYTNPQDDYLEEELEGEGTGITLGTQ